MTWRSKASPAGTRHCRLLQVALALAFGSTLGETSLPGQPPLPSAVPPPQNAPSLLEGAPLPSTETVAPSAGPPASGSPGVTPAPIQPTASPASAQPTPPPSSPASSPSGSVGPPPAGSPDPPAASSGSFPRIAIPDADALTAADALVHEVYAREYTQASDAAKRKALAKLFYEEARETDDHPAACFVLLREARELAKGVGDAGMALAAVDEMARRFEIDGQAVRQETLRELADSVRTAPAAREVAHLCLQRMDEAAGAEQFGTAMDYARTAYAAARKSRDGALVQEALDRGKAVQLRQQEHEQIAGARTLLAAQPDDPAANLAVGRYFCLLQHDWSQGLPLLVKGGDSPYREAAELDLAQPATPEGQLAVGDRWWDLAEAQPESERTALRERAGFWYRQAQDKLAGLARTKATRRLVELEGYRMGGAAASEAPPAAKPEGEKPAAPSSAQGPNFPAGEWVDLLPWIDPAKDQHAPAWRNTGKAVEGVPASAPAVLMFPVHPQGDYALRLQFTRVAGFGMVGVVLPIGSRQCLLAVNYNGQSNGIDIVNGQRADHNATTFAGALNNGRRYALEVRVKLDGENVQITAELDGRPLVSYSGPAASLAMHRPWSTPRRDALGLHCQAAVQFEAIQFQSVTGAARFAR